MSKSWAFSLANAETLPLTGELHPLRREAAKWLTWSNGATIFIAVLIFGLWWIWSHRTPEEEIAPNVEIVKFVELGVPPPISQASSPQVNVADVAPPSIGVPEPVPEVQAQATTIATQAEMSDALAPITMSDLGEGMGDSIVVGTKYVPPSPTEGGQVVDEMPVRLTIDPPRYPELARQAGVEGTVLVKALVGRDGKVKKAVVESGGPEMLRIPALDCARSAIFRPALQQNQPVEVWVRIPITFSLGGN